MKVVQVNFRFDDTLTDPDALLDRYTTLTGWSRALLDAGAACVSVVQRFSRAATVTREGVHYTFYVDHAAAQRSVVASCPDIVHVNGLDSPPRRGRSAARCPRRREWSCRITAARSLTNAAGALNGPSAVRSGPARYAPRMRSSSPRPSRPTHGARRAWSARGSVSIKCSRPALCFGEWITPKRGGQVLNAFYPTVTDRRLTGARRALLRTMSSWRYAFRMYAAPYELRAVHRVMQYQRPETTGF